MGSIRRVCIAAMVATIVAWPLAPRAAAFDGNASIELSKTVGASTLTPTLGLTLTVNPDRGIPGDQLAYRATVANNGANAGLAGTFTAASQSDIDSTVAAYYDAVEYFSGPDQKWIPFAVASAAQPGYTAFEPPPAAGAMTLQLSSIASDGVTYPATGDAIVGTRIAKGATASWSYQASIPLTPAQLALLLDPTTARAVRNVVHFEVTPRKLQNGQPYVQRVDFTAQWRTLSSGLTNTVVTIVPPSGAPVATTVGALAPGASATASASFLIPVPAAKASDETDAAYLARLGLATSTPLVASAHASATAADGTLVNTPAPDPTASATVLLPIVRISKQGPATADAGTTVQYTIGLQNTGSAQAQDLAVDDLFPGGAHVATNGVPATLDPGGAPVSAQASFDIPLAQPVGDLTDTASVTWRDANANLYGPISATFTTRVTASGAGSTLVLAPATAGPNVTGTSQTLTVTATDKDGVTIAGLAVHLAITGANPTTADATTDATGLATFTYTGTTRGNDTAQATATYRGATLTSNTSGISWVTPIQQVTTTTVLARVFTSDNSGVFRTPATETPQFTQLVPTINFNPPAGTVPHNTSGVGVFTRPFTNVTTDLLGNFTGAIPLEGNGKQAGVGSLFNFNLVLTGEFTIATAGDVTFNFFSDDGFILGIANGATRVSGPMLNVPPDGLTTFERYTIVGAFNAPTSPRANTIVVNFPAAGSYPYEVDYTECCGGQLAITMTQGPARTGVPPSGSLSLTPITIVAKPVGQTQFFTVAAMDASGVPIADLPVVLSITGPNTQEITETTDASGIAIFSYQAANAGTDHAQAGASLSGMPAISNLVNVPWSAVPAPKPTIGALSPADGETVLAPVAIMASFAPPSGQTIVSWSVTYRRAGTTTDVTLASGTGTPPGTLATFDPTRLPNGVYAVTVSATASGGGVQTSTTNLTVDGALKLGRYVTTYRDLAVPVAGLPMQVFRTYDSYEKAVGDFGVGWRLELANFHVATARPLGLGGWTQYNAQCFFGLCLTAFRTSVPHAVSVTWPDGRQEIFDFTPDGGSNIFWTGTAKFTARPGTTSKLQALGPTGLDYFADGNLYSGGVVYDPQRFLLTARDGTAYTIDRGTGLVSARDRAGNTLTVSPSGVTSSLGPSLAFTRDGLGRITQIVGPTGETFRYGYSPAGDLVSFTDGASRTISFEYSADHNLLVSRDPANRPFQTVTYDADGRLASVTDGAGNTTEVRSDVSARQETRTDAAGRLTTITTFDERGDPIEILEVFDGSSRTTRLVYDATGNLASVTDPLGRTSTLTHDTLGNLTGLRDPLGRTTTFVNDAAGELRSIVLADGSVAIDITRDANENPTAVDYGGGTIFRFTYDGSGRLATAMDPAGGVSTYTYDARGNLAAYRDASGALVQTSYDASGRITSVTDAAGATTSFEYDGDGNVVRLRDANARPWTYAYDVFGHLLSETDPLGHTRAWTYDAAGRIVSRTDRNGQTTTHTYDANGALIGTVYPDGALAMLGHDGLGRLIRAENADARVDVQYDLADRVVSLVTSAVAGSALPTTTVSYAYDAAGRRASMTTASGETRYAYDALDRLVQLVAPAGTFDFGWDALGRLSTLSRPNGVNTSYQWNVGSDLTDIVHSHGASVVDEAHYSYGPSGLRESMTDRAGTHAYTYDPAARLIGADHPGSRPDESYAYDAVGNRTSGGAVYDAANRLTGDAVATYTYDAEGRLLTKTLRADGAVTRFNWSADGRLRSVQAPDGTTTTYRYDALQRRVERSGAGGAVRYGYGVDDAPALEYDGTNAIVARYTFGLDPDMPLVMSRGGSDLYYLQDAMANVTGLTDTAGALAESYEYGSFGQLASGASSFGNPFTFGAHGFNGGSGTYHFRAREYDPATGRFLSEDPRPAANLYAYALNNPITFRDPTGGTALSEYAGLIAQRVRVSVAAGPFFARYLIGQTYRLYLYLAGIGGAAWARQMGQLGEWLSGVTRTWERIASLTGTAAYRIPDVINHGLRLIQEVKFVNYLPYTNQLRDFVLYAAQRGYTFELIVRKSTELAPELQRLVNTGQIILRRILP